MTGLSSRALALAAGAVTFAVAATSVALPPSVTYSLTGPPTLHPGSAWVPFNLVIPKHDTTANPPLISVNLQITYTWSGSSWTLDHDYGQETGSLTSILETAIGTAAPLVFSHAPQTVHAVSAPPDQTINFAPVTHTFTFASTSAPHLSLFQAPGGSTLTLPSNVRWRRPASINSTDGDISTSHVQGPYVISGTVTYQAIPEPTTMLLGLAAVMPLLAHRRRARVQAA